MDQSIESERPTDTAAPQRATDLVETLRELCIVFRAESGIACRTVAELAHVYCEPVVGDAVNRTVSLLLQFVSTRARATLVALSIVRGLDGSVLVRVDIDEPAGDAAEEMPPVLRRRLSKARHRLFELGVRFKAYDGSHSALLVVPGSVVSATD